MSGSLKSRLEQSKRRLRATVSAVRLISPLIVFHQHENLRFMEN